MGNVSYDRTKQMRSAAGTARTTPGISGTTSAPSQFQYGNALGTPSTPMGVNPQQHLSKAAGGKGAGAGGGKPEWLQNSQNRFQRRIQHQNRSRSQRINFGEGSTRPLDYGHPEQSSTVTQQGPTYQSEYFRARFGDAAPTTPEEYETQMQQYLNQNMQDFVNQSQTYQNGLRNSYQEWIQNRIDQGLL